MELRDDFAIFVGFKLDGSLRHQLSSISGPDQKYVSREESTFLTLCNKGSDTYVGKVVTEKLTTDRIDDIRRNVLSIVSRLCPEVRLPQILEIWVCQTGAVVPDYPSSPAADLPD